MKHWYLPTLFLLIVSNAHAQIDLQCNTRDKHSIYGSTSQGIKDGSVYRIDSVDTTPTEPKLLNATTMGIGGVSINKNLNDGIGNMAFYRTRASDQFYQYWNDTGWVTTGHDAITANPGGGSKYIYSFNGGNGDMYRYDGTGDATILMPGLPGNSPMYDVAVDKAHNFYLLYPEEHKVRMYTQDGILINTFTITGDSISKSGGPGFAILSNKMYCMDISNVLYRGTVTGNNINFIKLKEYTGYRFTDIAACPDAAEVLGVFNHPAAPHFAVYPNPATDYATLKLHNTETITITDMLGRTILTETVKGQTSYQLSLSHWMKGMYVVTAYSSSGEAVVGKVVVR